MRILGITTALAAAICLSICAPAAAAEASARKVISIPAQNLGPALQALAKERELHMVFVSEDVRAFRTQGVSGNLTTDEALRQLLNGTGLTYEYIDTATVSILPAKSLRSTSRGSQAELTGRQGFRLVQQNAENAAPAQQGGRRAEAPADEELQGVPEVLVKGSKILNMDIKRTRDDVQPYVVFDRSTIERSGATTLEDFFKTRLTMNTTQQDSNQIAGGGALRGNQSSINLRGLGSAQTLILVDGRRMAGIFTTAVEQPDINGISLGSIERIEVLPSTASGIYGGSATGGVINIILRRDYSGLETKLTYENTTESDSGVRKLDVNAGFNLEGGKTQVLLSGSYSDANPLRVEERDFVQRSRALMLANNANNYTVFNIGNDPPRGATTNIRSVNGSNLQFKPGLGGGANLGSSFAFLPNGYAASAADLAALAGNGGRYNLELPNDYTSRKAVFLSHPKTESASLNLRRQFGSRVQAFLDGSLVENHSIAANIGPGSTSTTLQATAPNNPFTTAIRVAFPIPQLNNEFDSDTTQKRVAGGIIVQLPHRWTLGADYTWNRSDKFFQSWSAMTPAGIAALADGTLDVMRDLNVYPLNYQPTHLFPRGNQIGGPWEYTVHNPSLRLAGPVFSMPGGPLTLSTLAERREEKLSESTVLSSNGLSSTIYPERTQTVNSAYVEARLPLVSEKNAMFAIRELEGQISVRRDDYRTHGVTSSVASTAVSSIARATNVAKSTDVTVGLRYSPIQDAVLRVSYGTGFLPPSLTQVVPGLPFSVTFTDARRGGASFTASLVSGGNPNLTPEESKSLSAGVILTPRVLPGLRLSVDYTRIEKENEITALGFIQGLELEDVVTGLVTRAASCPGDPYAPVCPIIALDFRTLNATQAELEAFDMQLDYSLPGLGRFGSLDFFAVATWQPHLKRKFNAATEFVELVGFNDGVLKFKANAGVTWRQGNWTAGWTTRYIDSYLAYTNTATPATIATAVLNQGSATIPDRYFHDLFARYDFNREGWLSGAEIGLTVRNVFNTDPPILASISYSAGSSYSAYSDPRLRSYVLSLRKSFQ